MKFSKRNNMCYDLSLSQFLTISTTKTQLTQMSRCFTLWEANRVLNVLETPCTVLRFLFSCCLDSETMLHWSWGLSFPPQLSLWISLKHPEVCSAFIKNFPYEQPGISCSSHSFPNFQHFSFVWREFMSTLLCLMNEWTNKQTNK